MIERAVKAGVPFGWVTADELYGQDTKFRLWLEGRRVAHVVAVAKNAMVVSMELAKVRVNRMIADFDDAVWQRLSRGDGTRGPRASDWAVVDIRPLRDPAYGHWLLARRSIADPSDIAYDVCFGPVDTAREELVRVAGARWAIEECLKTTKNEAGLDPLSGTGLPSMGSIHHPVHGRRSIPCDSPRRRQKRGAPDQARASA
jgi:SRSO17 transposase